MKSNTSANGVTTASRTKTKRSVTRTHFTSVAIRGRAPLLTATTKPLSILAMPLLPTPTRVTLHHNHLGYLHNLMFVDIAVRSFPTSLHRIGMHAVTISLPPTSLESVTRAKSSTAQTTSDNTSNTAMGAQAASGQTCWRIHV